MLHVHLPVRTMCQYETHLKNILDRIYGIHRIVFMIWFYFSHHANPVNLVYILFSVLCSSENLLETNIYTQMKAVI